MNLKRTTMMVAGSAALAAWWSAAMTPVRRSPVIADVEAPRPAQVDQEALAKEIARLHERLRPEVTPRAQPRNLFAFRPSSRGPARTSATSATSIVEPPPSATAAPFTLTLVGLAEDAARGTEAMVRTAIISGDGQVYLVKDGDSLVARDRTYTVSRVTADGVDLTDRGDGTLRRLTLR